MNLLRILRRTAAAAVTLTASAGLTLAASPQANAVGDTNYDAQGFSYTLYGTACTVTAGQPVVVTLNGIRTLQATHTLSCNRPVNVAYTHSRMGTHRFVVEKNTRVLYGVTSASVIQRAPCRTSVNTSYASYTEWGIDFNRAGSYDESLADLSNWNLRSCGI